MKNTPTISHTAKSTEESAVISKPIISSTLFFYFVLFLRPLPFLFLDLFPVVFHVCLLHGEILFFVDYQFFLPVFHLPPCPSINVHRIVCMRHMMRLYSKVKSLNSFGLKDQSIWL